MTTKAGLIILKYLLSKSMTRKLAVWKFISVRKRPRNISKIPLPKSVKDSLPRDKTRPESPGLRIPASESSKRPNSARPTSAPPKRGKLSDDVGARLHNKAQEIEQKKQKIRKSLKVDYSFRPTLAENTNRWLNRSTRENHKSSHEEIAVVSSASILNFTRNPPVNTSLFVNQDPINLAVKVKPIILSRSDFKNRETEIKENFFN